MGRHQGIASVTKMEYGLIAFAILYLIPGFVLLARRPEGRNLCGEAAYMTLLWPLYLRGRRE
jgi:hypothetical protein